MNRIYRLIWSDKSGTFVAVAEIVKSGKKSSGGSVVGSGGSRFALKGLAVSLMLAFASNAYALPNGGSVTAGGAIITSTGTSTTISQSTANAAINWQSFSIGQGEAVQFVQPNSSSITLNRVLGPDPSSILGNLSANGKVFLLNPNGILFGQGAQVNVGGLVATTLNLSDSDFMAGRYQFSGAGSGAILNQGSINADGGYVALLGAQVSNEGVISARLGTVALAAGKAITLDLAGDELLNVTVNQGAVNALVQNGGLIQADGGQVLLTAMAAGSLLQSAVNNTGVIQAQSIENHNGTIKLMGDMQSGTVNVGGTLDASAPNGGDGGFIETSAAHVKIANGTIINTQSAQGKAGTWLIDPFDFTIGDAIGDDITPADLATALAGNVIISSNDGDSGVDGDINVNNDVTWGAATTLTLNAVRNVNLNANITATTGSLVLTAGTDIIVNAMPGTGITTTDGSITWTAGNDIWVKPGVVGGITATRGDITWIAGRDITVDSAVTTTDGNFTACCGRDISISAAMTMTRGDVVLKAGNDGSGLGVAGVGGTVAFVGAGHYTVTGAVGTPVAITIDYTPSAYDTPTDFSGNFTLTDAVLTSHMLVFAQGNDKVYDGNTTATLSFRGNPTLGGNDVTLLAGTATFDDKNVASDIGITYSGYTLGGADAGEFALWAPCASPAGSGRTSADITQAPLTLQANDASKIYGQTFTPASTAFTVLVAPVAGETVTGVTETSTGSAATATVAGSTYPIVITPGSATGGGGFSQTNYTIIYVDGALTVTPLALTGAITAADKVYDATTAATITSRTLPGVLNDDVVTYTAGTASFATPAVGVGKTVTGTGLVLAGADAGNYTVNPDPTTTASITAAPPVVPPVVIPPIVPTVVVPLVVSPVLVMPVTPQIGAPAWTPQVSDPTAPPQLTEAQFLPPPVAPAPISVPVEPMPIVVPAPVEPVPVIVPQESAPKPFVPVLRPRKADRN